MKNLFVIVVLFVALKSNAQSPITANGFEFKQGNKAFSFKEIAGVVQNNKLANEKYWEARTDRSNSFILASVGAVGLGIPVYLFLKNGTTTWFFTRYTLPLMAGGIVCEIAAIKKRNKAKTKASVAMGIYNNSIKTSSILKTPPDLFFVVTPSGSGIKLKF